jgi:hypothetical protein
MGTPPPSKLKSTLKRYLKNRKGTIQALQFLEETWRECSEPLPHLNRQPLWPRIKDPKAQLSIKQVEEKIRAVEKLQQETFLMFQKICVEKHEEQIPEGEKLIKRLSEQPIDDETLQDFTLFFLKESKIHQTQSFNLSHIKKTTHTLLRNVEKIKKLPCSDQKMEALMGEKIEILKDFLTSTIKLLP